MKKHSLFFLMAGLLFMATASICSAQLEWTSFSIDDQFYQSRDIYAADIDLDGDMDFVAAGDGIGQLNWYENVNPPLFICHEIYEGDAPFGVFVTDMDGDGDMDILGTLRSPHDTFWWENDGNQDFTQHLITSENGGGLRIHAADFDDDGDMDVYNVGYNSDIISIFVNDDGVFREQVISDHYSGAHDIEAVDMDLDGDIDILTCAMHVDRVSWWENNDDVYAEHIITRDFDGASAVMTVDIDRDGDLDVVSAGYEQDEVALFENDGQMGFTYHMVGNRHDWANAISVADFDQDGEMDIVSCAFADDDLIVWLNHDEYPFERLLVEGNFDGALALDAADFDGDGDFDIVCGAYGANEIRVWYNGELHNDLAEVHGIVSDADSNQPIENATVQLGHITVMTNDQGVYSVDNFPYGDYALSITAELYIPLVDDILIDMEEIEYNASLQLGTCELRGVVLDGVTEEPITGATITIGEWNTTTGDEGNFLFDAIPYGTYMLTVDADHYPVWQDEIRIESPEMNIILPIYEQMGSLHGIVRDATNNDPIAGAVFGIDGRTTTTNVNGQFEVNNLDYDDYDYTVSADQYHQVEDQVEIDEPVVNLEVLLSPFNEGEPYFTPVAPTGMPYAVVVEEAFFNESMLSLNDEIGIFDGDLCVGADLVNGEWPLPMTTWEGDWEAEMPGFISGNTILYNYYINELNQEFSADADYERGNGTFGDQAYCVVTLSASSIHFNPVQPTGLPYGIIIQEPFLEELEMFEGDEIAAFDGDLCVGSMEVDNVWPRNMTTWEQDLEHELPGFTSGNPMEFRFWSWMDNTEHTLYTQFLQGDGTFGYEAFSEVFFTDFEVLPMNIPLQGNYFEMISFYVMPQDLSAEANLGSIFDLSAVYEDNGDMYIPDLFDSIVELDFTEGYKIYCLSNTELSVVGRTTDPTLTFSLGGNRWNWIGYPFPISISCEIALDEIADITRIMMTDDGRMWAPSLGINSIGDMIPGEGYLVFADEAAQFQYTIPEYVASSGINPEHNEHVEDNRVEPTGLPYAVLVRLSDDLQQFNPCTIEIYDENTLVGVSDVVPGDSPIPVVTWQGSEEHNLTGFKMGNPIQVRIKDPAGEIVAHTSGGTFGEAPYTEIYLDASALAIPREFSVGAAYPNPFNPSLIIPYTIPESGVIDLTIFNVLGQQVFVESQFHQAGHHSFQFDSEMAGTDLVSGVYLVQIQYDGVNQIQKVLLLK